jgi:GH35 family endo-1,4-beta-xylanase
MTLKILDENRKPLADITVVIKQVQHDFLFGCGYPLESQLPQDVTRFRELFSSLFNYLSTENHFKWSVLEPRQGTIDYGQIDRLLSWAQSKDIKVLGHTLVWGNWPSSSGSGVPSWIRDKSRDEIRQLMENRIKQIVSRYAGKIAVWSVLSEPIHVKWFDEHFGEDYIELSFKWARETDPKPKLLIDEYNILTNYRDMEKYLNIVRNLKSKSVPLDIVGVEEVDASIWLSPRDIYRGLDEIAEAGYEIQVTQFTVHGAGQPIAGGFRTGVWNEQTQAEYFEMFYRTAFSHRKVKAITTWSFLDPGWKGTNCGIVRADLTPKPAYEALNRLINREWRTSITTKTDEKGMVQFRGFFGTYELAATLDGEKRTLTFHLGENETRDLELVATKTRLEPKSLELQRYVLPLGILSILMVSVSFVALRKKRSPKKTNA